VAKIGAIILEHCFLVNEVATRGYSIDFMMVLLRQYQASSFLMRLQRREFAHVLAFFTRYFTSSDMLPEGLVKIPSAFIALCGENLSMGSRVLVESLRSKRSAGVALVVL
jgi:hypothetical protein